MNVRFKVYCHGDLRDAQYIGDGWAICLCCGARIMAVPPGLIGSPA